MVIDRLRHRARLFSLIALLGVSSAATAFGIRGLMRFDLTPGTMGKASSVWPSGSTIDRLPGKPELVVFVHPQCSCSFATFDELSKLETTAGIDVLFYRPRGSGWTPNALWTKAQQLQGAHLRWDDDGREAGRFGAATSGVAMLYSARGELLFRGGVTGSRGHQGDNLGLQQLASSLASGRPATKRGFVFGCSLVGQT